LAFIQYLTDPTSCNFPERYPLKIDRENQLEKRKEPEKQNRDTFMTETKKKNKRKKKKRGSNETRVDQGEPRSH